MHDATKKARELVEKRAAESGMDEDKETVRQLRQGLRRARRWKNFAEWHHVDIEWMLNKIKEQDEELVRLRRIKAKALEWASGDGKGLRHALEQDARRGGPPKTAPSETPGAQ